LLPSRVLRPSVDEAVRKLRPDFRAISIIAEGVENRRSHTTATEALADACQGLNSALWAEAHVEAWREAFRSFGARPKKTPSSVEALRSRAAKGGELPSINAVVDLYNAISVKFALPVGGEDLDAYAGQPRLVMASGSEKFDTVRDGADVAEGVDAGQVIWRDDLGATCRRWNWRQCNRTRIGENSSNLWFVLEALEPMADEALHSAGAALCDGLARISRGASIRMDWIR